MREADDVGEADEVGEAHETLEEFNKEFNIIDHLSDEAKAAEEARLEEIEDEINKNNNDPDSTFKEALEEWSDLPEEEFLKEKTGLTEPGMVTNQTFFCLLFSNDVLRINQVITWKCGSSLLGKINKT